MRGQRVRRGAPGPCPVAGVSASASKASAVSAAAGGSETVRRAAERAARDAYGRVLARLARRTGDVAAAEDALSAAFAKALVRWPVAGVPDKPAGWLTAVAWNEARDAVRRSARATRSQDTLRLLAEERNEAAEIGDERLGLMLAATHPAIDPTIHAPLVLQTIFGLSAAEIAPILIVPPATLGQRLARAKRKIKLAGLPFDPDPPDRTGRIGAILEAIYGLFTVASAAPPSALAAERAADARALVSVVLTLEPDDPEASGLSALIAFAGAREPARRDPCGGYVPLSQQDPALWDAALLAEAEAALATAARARAPGPYQLEAAIQSVHCDRLRSGSTRWDAIAVFYDALCACSPSVGAEVARAAAHEEAYGAAAGLALLSRIPQAARTLYQPYWAVRAHLERAGGHDSEKAYDRAIAMTGDEAVRTHLARLRDAAGRAATG